MSKVDFTLLFIYISRQYTHAGARTLKTEWFVSGIRLIWKQIRSCLKEHLIWVLFQVILFFLCLHCRKDSLNECHLFLSITRNKKIHFKEISWQKMYWCQMISFLFNVAVKTTETITVLIQSLAGCVFCLCFLQWIQPTLILVHVVAGFSMYLFVYC